MAYANASDCVPEPCHVAGTPLNHFSLGHHLLFVRLALPFADAPMADATPDQILEGVALCAADPIEAQAAMLSGEWPDIVARWLKRVRKEWRKRKGDWETAESLFRAYLIDGYRSAPVMQYASDGGTIKLTAPWENLLKCRLVMAGFSEREVLTGYLPARWYDYFTVCEIEGAKNCTDSKKWKPVFYTRQMSEQLKAVDALEGAGNG